MEFDRKWDCEALRRELAAAQVRLAEIERLAGEPWPPKQLRTALDRIQQIAKENSNV